MSSSFAALMALSASQTQQSQSAVQSALAERQRKEAAQRKAQEEKERKEREIDAKIRLRRLEDDKREQERRERLERERAAKEKERQRREQEQQERLLGTKKRRIEYPSSSTGSGGGSGSAGGGGGVRRRADDDDDSSAMALTREEKRERKLQAELRREFNARSGRSVVGGGYGRMGKRLAGGAVDIVTSDSAGTSVNESAGGIKARLLAMPNTLTKLNVNKRDTRTIDEILQDRAKAREVKVLDGDQAREFNDWFGTKKKETASVKPSSPPKSGTGSPAPVASSSKSATMATLPKKPLPAASKPTSLSRHVPQPPSKPATSYKTSVPSFTKRSTGSTTSKTPSKPTPTSRVAATTSSAPAKRRPRSSSLDSFDSYSDDDDEYDRRLVSGGKRRRTASPGPSASSISQEIWKLFGKDKRSYMERDVLSDDEDMEVGATVLEKEELRSQRIAKKEDQEAEEEEKRHAEEKKRRAKERRH